MEQEKLNYEQGKIRLIFSFKEQSKGHSGVGFAEIETFETLKEAIEFVSNHTSKKDMKFIEITSTFMVSTTYFGGTHYWSEHITFFRFDQSDCTTNINAGRFDLRGCVPSERD